MTDSVFKSYSAYYDLIYNDKNYASEADYVERLLKSANPGIMRLLEFGSGTGKHAQLLTRRGFDVFGIEKSEAMVAVARLNSAKTGMLGSGKFECRQGDIRHTRIDGEFDAVIALFHVMSYQAENNDALMAMTNASNHLRVGGTFLFDVWHGPAVLGERPVVRVKRAEDLQTRLIRIAEPELDVQASVVKVKYTIFAEKKADGRTDTLIELHRMRYFFPTEIDLLARSTGFVVERTEEFHSGKPASAHSWGVVYVLRKQ